mmetsp:Transcript_4319/g.6278  ORF Transcript_4319/g.6278 Transcript_4319/m.6278 type:complete len:140 (-) Transcript_4319:41-460(-)
MVTAAAPAHASPRIVRRMLAAPPYPVSPSTINSEGGDCDDDERDSAETTHLVASSISVCVSNPASGEPRREAVTPKPLKKSAFAPDSANMIADSASCTPGRAMADDVLRDVRHKFRRRDAGEEEDDKAVVVVRKEATIR